MSARARRPTDEIGTEVYDPERQRALLQKPPPAGTSLTPLFESFEDATEVTPPPRPPAVESATPTHIDPLPLERSEPIRVISMKDHMEAEKPRRDDARAPRHVRLRSMAEVTGRNDAPVRLGNLAPPRDPRQARARRVRDNVVWACVAIALAGALAFAIWLIAGR